MNLRIVGYWVFIIFIRVVLSRVIDRFLGDVLVIGISEFSCRVKFFGWSLCIGIDLELIEFNKVFLV